ncbi:MAG TPA: hypothetical protein VMN78_08700 [Longimicrobiales bacterium]|nr:hypothetical protein [Longimicrobiales bacterium]
MSRAFVNEDAAGPDEGPRFTLPAPDDPGFDGAAALAMLEGAREGHTRDAEEATGYRWGDAALAQHVERLIDQELARPADERDRRLIQVGRRYLRAVGE